MPVQTIDIHKTAVADNGIDFTAGPGTFWIVGPDVIVASDLGNGVNSTEVNSVLINHGFIAGSSLSSYGVQFFENGIIYNDADGSIVGRNGIGVDGSYVGVINLGSIVATQSGVVFNQSSANSSLDNRGSIYSAGFGVVDLPTSGSNTIANSGTIEGDTGGIGIGTAAGTVTSVVNSGTIHGGTNTIVVVTGALNLQNSGKVIGGIVLGPVENDVITNHGSIAGIVHLGGGNDIFNGTGGTSGAVFGEAGNDTLTGGSSADTLFGGIGNDTLNGGLGNDRLLGEAGNDKLTGSAGNDIFVFNTALNAATNRDTITDFNHVADTFQLENAIFTKLGAGVHALNPLFFHVGAAAADANDFIVYNQATGVLSYDANGNAAGGAIVFAQLANHAVLAANDFAVI